MGTNLLTVITPVTSMAGKLHDLKSWVHLAGNLNVSVVLVHDFRDEETEMELTEIENSYSHVRLISGKFGSPGAARNAGLHNLDADWLAFWDCDDRPEVQSFINMIEYGSHQEILVGNYQEFKEGFSRSENIVQIDSKNSMASLISNPGIWRIAFRQSAIHGVLFQPLKMAEDQLFLYEVLSRDPLVSFHPEVVYGYRRGFPGQLTLNRVAMKDLGLALKYMESRVSEGKTRTSYAQYFLGNLQISGIKNGPWSVKLKAIKSVLRSLSPLKPRSSIRYASAFMQILRSKIRSHA